MMATLHQHRYNINVTVNWAKEIIFYWWMIIKTYFTYTTIVILRHCFEWNGMHYIFPFIHFIWSNFLFQIITYRIYFPSKSKLFISIYIYFPLTLLLVAECVPYSMTRCCVRRWNRVAVPSTHFPHNTHTFILYFMFISSTIYFNGSFDVSQ